MDVNTGDVVEYGHLDDRGPVVMAPIASLLPSDSPRIGGEDGEHVRELAELDASLPPIVVHRATMRVIDGMHRLRAAVLRGEELIAVRYFDGSDLDAFVLAVRLNSTHGLPLSPIDRASAAARIIRSHPHLSDRAIAETTGLAHKTVAAIRSRSAGEVPQPDTRVGLDGRVRPLNAAQGRLRARDLIASDPKAPLRQISRSAGVSVSTARDVRERLRRGQDPVPLRQRRAKKFPASPHRDPAAPEAGDRYTADSLADDAVAALETLRMDPSLRFTEAGRTVLRLLDVHVLGVEGWDRLVDGIPEHCSVAVADIARSCAESWREFARQLELPRTERPAAAE